ncbi:MAG TPA: 50S ribosomal protein L11 methyltransferase [Solirubrobacteraceae bacterium]|nr:50S ribosomal protein L11 methyltransferase [Solirubrobacteraceae bacterium]
MIRLAIRVRRQQAELVLAELLSLAPSGVEESAIGDDVVEYAVYGPPGELPDLPDVQAAAGGALVEVSSTEIADDWAERWRSFHRPLVLDGRLRVRPPWEPAGAEALDVVIDPGRAFGTGAHATTRLCLELLLELPADRRALIDLGCGSGVLAIVAARLGYGPVIALDFDPAAVAATAANATVNDVELEIRRFDVRFDDPPAAPVVVANLLGPLLLDWAGREWPSGSPQLVVASGLLVAEADRVAAAFAHHGLRERERRQLGEWATLLLSSGPAPVLTPLRASDGHNQG